MEVVEISNLEIFDFENYVLIQCTKRQPFFYNA